MKHNDNFKTLIYEPLKGILKDKEFFPDEFQLSDVISGFDSSPQKVTRNTLYRKSIILLNFGNHYQFLQEQKFLDSSFHFKIKLSE